MKINSVGDTMLERLGHEIKNQWMTMQAYPDMSPDLGLRRKLARQHQSRPNYSRLEWHHRLWRSLGVRNEVSEFIYDALTEHTGLEVGRFLASDRLVADLQLPSICWFDWEVVCMEQFWQRFQLPEPELEDWDTAFDPTTFDTLQDWVLFLNQTVNQHRGSVGL